MKATFFIGDRLRINIPVVKKNHHTVWVTIYRKNEWGKPIRTHIKRHIRKHGVILS